MGLSFTDWKQEYETALFTARKHNYAKTDVMALDKNEKDMTQRLQRAFAFFCLLTKD